MAADVLGNLCGFFTVIGGIFLLHAFKDMAISWRDVSSAKKSTSAQVDEEAHTLLDSDEGTSLRDHHINGDINRT